MVITCDDFKYVVSNFEGCMATVDNQLAEKCRYCPYNPFTPDATRERLKEEDQ